MVHGLRPAAFGRFHVAAAKVLAVVAVLRVVTQGGDLIVTNSGDRVVVDA